MATMFKKWRSSGRETVHLGRNQSVKGDVKPKWPLQAFWRKIKRGKKKIFNVSAPVPFQASYDPEEYSQNFDQGTAWSEPDNLPRSFSARFADPSRINLQKSNTVR